MEPTLVNRGTNSDYASARRYHNIHFLNAQTICAVDSRGDLDIVGLPLGPTAGRRDGGDASTPGKGSGSGTRLAHLPLAPPPSERHPREPVPRHAHFELFGYQGGRKLAVGLPSGQVRLFAPERATAARAGAARGAPASAAAAWSCLPPTRAALGPRRRFARGNHEECSLLRLLAPVRRDDRGFRAAMAAVELDEVQGWDDGAVSLWRSPLSCLYRRPPLWAFREDGTVLLGACVDPELDCFSLRMMDERVGDTVASVTAGENVATPSVFVGSSTHSAAAFSAYNNEEDVTSICFSGEHGLVTNHRARTSVCDDGCNGGGENLIKWWDRRMLRDSPVAASTLVFPRDDVAGVTPAATLFVHGDVHDGAWRRVSLRAHGDGRASTVDATASVGASHLAGTRDRAPASMSRLVGSRDWNDRLVIVLGNSVDLEGFAVVDASRRQVVRSVRVRGDGVRLPCFSSNLDFAAHGDSVRETEAAVPADCISIYDISQHAGGEAGRGRAGDRERRAKKRRGADYFGGADEPDTAYTGFLGKIKPRLTDAYGIESSLSCMAMDELGSRIACGTADGDIFIV